MRNFLRLVAMLYRLTPQWSDGADAVRALQARRLRQFLLHAKQHSPFCNRRFAGIDVTQCRLSDLPTLSKSDMMANFEDVLTDRRIRRSDVECFMAEPGNLGKLFLGRYGICHTSGSQGQPALIVQDTNALMLTFTVQFARGTVVQGRWLPHVDRLWNPARMAVLTQRPGFYPSGAAFGYLPAAAKPFFKVLHLSVFDPPRAIEFSKRRECQASPPADGSKNGPFLTVNRRQPASALIGPNNGMLRRPNHHARDLHNKRPFLNERCRRAKNLGRPVASHASFAAPVGSRS